MPYYFVDEPSAPHERKKDPNIEENSEQNNPSFFYLLIQVLRILLAKPANHVAPVPDEVEEAGAEELEEPWEARLKDFVSKRMAPTDVLSHANTASEVREQFSREVVGDVQQRDVRLYLARIGFHETTHAVREGTKKSKKRIYRYNFGNDCTHFV